MRRLLLAVLVVALVAAHLAPGDTVPQGNDKAGHVLMGAALGLGLFLARRGRVAWRASAAAIDGLFLLALLEVLQALVPGRHVEVGDLAADAAGLAAALAAAAWWPRGRDGG